MTSKVSSNALTNSESSSSVSSLNASSSSSVDSFAMMWSFLILLRASGGLRGFYAASSAAFFSCSAAARRATCDAGALNRPAALVRLRLHRAGQLGQQHLARLQVGDALDLGDRQRAAVHVAALDDERLVVLGELLDRLGRVDRLALDERDRGGTDEQFVETLDAGLGRGPLDQRVLGDGVGRGVAERPAQLGEVGHRQPAVLGDDGGRRLLELLGDVGNGGGFVSLGHACLLVMGIGCSSDGRKGPEMTNAPTQTGRGAYKQYASSSCVGRRDIPDLQPISR